MHIDLSVGWPVYVVIDIVYDIVIPNYQAGQRADSLSLMCAEPVSYTPDDQH